MWLPGLSVGRPSCPTLEYDECPQHIFKARPGPLFQFLSLVVVLPN